MKPMLTDERARAVAKAAGTFAALARKYGPCSGQPELEASDGTRARKAASTLHDARLALLDLIGEKPTRYGTRRTYRHDPKRVKQRAINLMRQVGLLKGSADAARRQFDRMVQGGKITHPLDGFGQFALDFLNRFKFDDLDDDHTYLTARKMLAAAFPEKAWVIRRIETR